METASLCYRPVVQTRERSVVTDAENGGRGCDGVLSETRACNEQPCSDKTCPALTKWSQWGECSQSCRVGKSGVVPYAMAERGFVKDAMQEEEAGIPASCKAVELVRLRHCNEDKVCATAAKACRVRRGKTSRVGGTNATDDAVAQEVVLLLDGRSTLPPQLTFAKTFAKNFLVKNSANKLAVVKLGRKPTTLAEAAGEFFADSTATVEKKLQKWTTEESKSSPNDLDGDGETAGEDETDVVQNSLEFTQESYAAYRTAVHEREQQAEAETFDKAQKTAGDANTAVEPEKVDDKQMSAAGVKAEEAENLEAEDASTRGKNEESAEAEEADDDETTDGSAASARGPAQLQKTTTHNSHKHLLVFLTELPENRNLFVQTVREKFGADFRVQIVYQRKGSAPAGDSTPTGDSTPAGKFVCDVASFPCRANSLEVEGFGELVEQGELGRQLLAGVCGGLE